MESDLKPNDKIGYARKSLRDVLKDPDKTIPGLIFITTDRIVRMITRRKEKLPWVFNLIVLVTVIQIPTLAITILLKEYAQWGKLGLIWMGYIELGLSANIFVYYVLFYIYRNMEQYVIDAIQSVDDLKNLQGFLSYAGASKIAFYFTLMFTIFWCISFSFVSSLNLKQFIGVGLFSGTVVFGLLVGPALYMLSLLLIFIVRVGSYNYNLYETSPAHSEVIHHLSRIFNTTLYALAIFFALATMAVSNNGWAVVLVILIAWIPLIIYFISGQRTISRIITTSKLKTLNRIQNQIKVLNAGDITDKNTVETINRLMDYHERIRMTPNSVLNIGTGLTFLNQLALPLLGLLLANIEKILNLFR